MSVLDFLCDVRFHKSHVLPPNPHTGRRAPFRVSYADYGDAESNAVVLFCGALMGSRFCYSPLDQLAKAYNVRIIHPDRPGIGGTQTVDLEQRIQTWLGRSI
jgi:pimeloyl-ACP methyl ester carboxylesterase